MRVNLLSRWRSVLSGLRILSRKCTDQTLRARKRTGRLGAFEVLETRLLPTVTSAVIIDDPGSTQTADHDGLTQNLPAAGDSVAAANHAPTMSDFTAQTVLEDTPTSTLLFTIADAETAASDLTVTATSSNSSLIPIGNIAFKGSDAFRGMVITPAENQNGEATITVTVSDGMLTVQKTFRVTVLAVDDPAAITLDSQPLFIRASSKKAVAIDKSATIKDVDTAELSFTGASLKVSGQTAKDTVWILQQNGVSSKGSKLLSGKTVIGAVVGGKKGVPLTVVFNAVATQDNVQAVLQNISFSPASKTIGNRTLQMQMFNIGGRKTNLAIRQVRIEP